MLRRDLLIFASCRYCTKTDFLCKQIFEKRKKGKSHTPKCVWEKRQSQTILTHTLLVTIMRKHMSYDYPPYPYLEQVLKNCPTSGALYLKLWADRGLDNKISVEKKQVQTIFLTKTSNWLDRLHKLVDLGVVSYWMSKDRKKFEIELTDFDHDEELC